MGTNPKESGDEKPPVSVGEDEGESPFNPVALVFIALLVIGGLFMAYRMRADAKMQDCIQSGKRNCARIDEESLARPK